MKKFRNQDFLNSTGMFIDRDESGITKKYEII